MENILFYFLLLCYICSLACDKHKFNILVFLKNKFSCDFSKLDNLLNWNVLD